MTGFNTKAKNDNGEEDADKLTEALNIAEAVIDEEESVAVKAAKRMLKNALKQQNYTLDRAIEILKAQYEVSKKLELVNQPVAHALYQVWRLYDEFEPRRGRE